jgi:hypothetical protein
LIAQLDEVTSPRSAPELQNACVLSVLDAVDRKLLRDNIYEVMRDAFHLYGSVGRLRMSISIRDHFEKGSLTKEMLETAVKDITQDAELHRAKLLEKIRVQVQCPEDHDKLN